MYGRSCNTNGNFEKHAQIAFEMQLQEQHHYYLALFTFKKNFRTWMEVVVMFCANFSVTTSQSSVCRWDERSVVCFSLASVKAAARLSLERSACCVVITSLKCDVYWRLCRTRCSPSRPPAPLRRAKVTQLSRPIRGEGLARRTDNTRRRSRKM